MTPIQNNGKSFQEIVNFLIKDVDNPLKKDEVDESIMELKRIVDSLPTSKNGFPVMPGDSMTHFNPFTKETEYNDAYLMADHEALAECYDLVIP